MRFRRLQRTFPLAFLALPLLFANATAERDIVVRSEWIMGTICEVKARPADNVDIHAVLESAFQIFRRVDQLMSPYKNDSEVSELNRKASSQPFPLTQETFFVIDRALQFSAETQGAFDITVYPLVKTWGFFGLDGKVPSDEQISKDLELVGWRFIELKHEERSIRLKKHGVAIDLGGIAKGYAVDAAVKSLKGAGITSALVNVGGTLYGFGAGPDGKLWTAGIRDPKNAQRSIRSITLNERSIATSGDYERYFEENGKRYHHIFDPRTGKPAEGLTAVTVIAPTALEADALSTALFVMGEKEGQLFLENNLHIEAYFTPAR